MCSRYERLVSLTCTVPEEPGGAQYIRFSSIPRERLQFIGEFESDSSDQDFLSDEETEAELATFVSAFARV